MNTLLNQVLKEHQRLIANGREPDSLFLSEVGRDVFSREVSAAYGVSAGSIALEFLGMKIYVASQYRDNQFRIYCKPQFGSEF